MIISVNWLKKFVPNLPEIDELATLIGARLVEIEGVENLGEKYKDVIIARVVSAEKVENSDHLNLCKIDDGGVRQGVERDENGFIQVVCGAPNVRAGLFVAWLPPESIVPETFAKENFKLGARKLMGNMSNGMIASLRELALGDEHDGILEILPEVFENGVKAGDSFAEKFELNDFLLEVENKSLTHRPDCFGIIGFAREVAGILGQKFENPSWLLSAKNDNFSDEVELKTKIQNSEICKKYTAAIFDISNLRENPEFTIEKTYLLRSGMRPIDFAVDLANALMLESAQPLHTFDFDKLVELNGSENVKMTVRNAFESEELELLDGRKIKMSSGDIVIATGESAEIAVALAGAMGGISTATDENTKRILVESATFNLYNLRNTQMRHGIFSEAITRFTKGQPAELSLPVLAKFAHEISKNGGKQISKIVESSAEKAENQSIEISFEKINAVLGEEFSPEKTAETLRNVGFEVAEIDGGISARAPFWRTDIHIQEDLIEEIGRLNGYDNIALRLPTRTFRGVDFSKFDKLQAEIRQILVAGGANEVLTYSFIHGDLLEKFGQNPENSYRIVNSISPDLQFYRQTLTPSLLSKVNQNIRGGFDEFAIFEMNKITMKSLGLTDENVPNEVKNLAFVYSAKKGENAFYQAKYFASYLFGKLGLKLEVCEFSDENQLYGGFEPKRSAYLGITMNGDFVKLGVLGEFKKSVQKSMKLPEATAGFELNLEKLCEIWGDKKLQMRKLSKFQSVERDLSLKFEQEISFGKVEKAFEGAKNLTENIEIEISPIDIYEVENSKTISLRFKIIPFEKTLTGDEIREIVEKLEKIAEKLGAKIA